MKIFKSLTLILSLFIMGQTSYGQTSVFTNADQIALGGYDVVAYHNANTATRGNSEFTATHEGATYYFSSEDNQKVFVENPSNYLPQYGGYCAFAMAMEAGKVPSDPRTFKLRDGKLYLFFNDFYEGKPFNTIIQWNAKEKDMLVKADAFWKAL